MYPYFPCFPKIYLSGNSQPASGPALDPDSNKRLICGKVVSSDMLFPLSGFCAVSQVF